MNDTSLDCTHKHILQKTELHQQIWCPVPPVSLHVEFHVLTPGLMLQGYHTLVPGTNSFFRDSMGPFKGKAHRMLA